MKTLPSLVLTLPLLLAGLPALAETYKCKDPDGRITYQGQPCQQGAVGTTLQAPAPLPPEQVERAKADLERLRQQQDQDARQRQATEAQRAALAQAEAADRAGQCNAARRTLGVAKMEAPIYSFDNNGDRRYHDDQSRARIRADAERRVAAYCR